jgi:hypothetical protein
MKIETKQKIKEHNAIPEIKARNNERHRNYCNSTIERKIIASMRRDICLFVKRKHIKKTNSCLKLLDYSIQELKEHLEKQFSLEMNWNNYGNYWHIDHKIPCSWFHFKSIDDYAFKICWGLDNLQPLKKDINLKKNDSYADITPYHFEWVK